MEVQALIGRIKLRRIEAWHARRLANAERIWGCARQLSYPLKSPLTSYTPPTSAMPSSSRSDWPPAGTARPPQRINARGVLCFFGSCSEVYLEKAFNVASMPELSASPAQPASDSSSSLLGRICYCLMCTSQKAGKGAGQAGRGESRGYFTPL